jgi:S1-C subfamily serine protease
MSGRRQLIRAFAVAGTCSLCLAGAPPRVSAADAPASVENSVVKVFSTMVYPDAARPWARQAPTEATGSGVVIEGNRILTNAHVVSYASQIQVQANQEGDKVPATVEAMAPGIDLAVLKLDDESFFKTHAPLARAGKLTDVKDAVLVYGFPTGGNSLSITKGIVSRIEFVGYNYSTAGLRIQIDAAINPGNSGGPAVVGDQMIGLAFSNLSNAQNIGYIIPNEEITLFLQDVADGHYDGKPALYSELQTLENPGLRSYLKLDDSVHGIIVHEPYAPAGATSPLKEWDVIISIGDTPVDDQGMVKLDGNLRVRFPYLLSRTVKDGKAPLTIVRAGKTMKVSVPVYTDRPALIPDLKGAYPPYFIYGPIVFSKATTQFIGGFAKNADAMTALSGIGSPLITQRSAQPTPERQELVIISSPFFPHKLSKGYGNPFAAVVYSLNGTPVRDLKHLVSLLRDLKEDYLTIQPERKGGETLVFPRQEMVAATDAILSDNGVRAQGSADMMEIWQGKSGSGAATKH